MGLSTEDMLALNELLARYNWCFDSGDGQGWSDLWVEDGVFDNGFQQTVGRAALKTLVEQSYAMLEGGMRHHGTDLIADYGDTRDVILAKSYSLITNWQKGGQLFAAAENHWVVERSGGQLKLRQNKCLMRRGE